jgi:hypothetical protein
MHAEATGNAGMYVALMRVLGGMHCGCAFSLDRRTKMTNHREQSLRCVVEKWLAFNPPGTAKVIAFGRTPPRRGHYVCIETTHDSGSVTLYFFRHGDGCWRVFPPATTLPKMALERLAA